MNNESCKTCRFWKCVPRVAAFNNKLTDRYGECRISRPKMGGICDDKWPSTTDSDWCGEYQAAEQQSAGGMAYFATGCLHCGGTMDFVEIVNVKNAKSQCKQCGEQAFTPQGK